MILILIKTKIPMVMLLATLDLLLDKQLVKVEATLRLSKLLFLKVE
jgi:hypothetical protein